MSDKEDSSASLGNSEELSVQDPVGPPIPEFAHCPEDGTKVPSSVAGQNAGDILPDDPTWTNSLSKATELERQVATVIIQSASESGDAEGLAGSPSDQKVNWAIFVSADGGEIRMARHIRIVVSKNSTRKFLDFTERSRLPTQRLPRNAGGFNS